jgi:HYR domain/Regulator of chromosome condensation (RCC1) repeat
MRGSIGRSLVVVCALTGCVRPDASPVESRRSAVGSCAPVVTSMAVGDDHSCVVIGSPVVGEIRCWGANDVGQLGDGSTTPSTVPVSVTGGLTAIQVVVGAHHSCALGGAVHCWGANDTLQLGTTLASGSSSSTPVEAFHFGTATSIALDIASGGDTTCVTHNDAFLACWGNHLTGGQLDALDNVRVSGGGALPSSGPPNCAMWQDSTVRCWGSNGEGQLGDGTLNDADPISPVTPSGLGAVSAIATAPTRACAIDTAGTVKCWGDTSLGADGFGETPVVVDSEHNVTAVSSGIGETCLLRTDGSVHCFEGTSTTRMTMALPGPATSIALGDHRGCAALTAGGVQCWQWGTTSFPGTAPSAVHFCNDSKPPVFNSAPATIVRTAPDTSGTSVPYPVPTATDTVDGLLPSVCTPPPGHFPVGITTVTCVATDTSGNSATMTFDVEVDLPGASPEGEGGGSGAGGAPISGTAGSGGTAGASGGAAGSPASLPNAATCVNSTECATGFCVDGRCCATECAGGTTDCQACSIAAGGTTDGTCTPLAASTACADDGNVCTTDLCDGTSGVCQHAAGNANVVCQDAADACENPGQCAGTSSVCPGTTAIPDCTVQAFSGGTNVQVNVNGGLAVVGGAMVLFSQVNSAGDVTITGSTSGSPPPPDYGLVPDTPPRYFQIETTADYPPDADITVCIHYDQAWVGAECTHTPPPPPIQDECRLQLLHYDGSGTPSILPAPPASTGLPALDTVANIVCGLSHSLSPFALAVPLDKTPPVFAGVPGTITAYAANTNGANVIYTPPTATDANDGPTAVSCAPASGSLFPPGLSTVTCSTADGHGNPNSVSFTVWVQYKAAADGTFFLDPINPDGSSIFKKGSTVPVKFRLQGASAGIKNLVAHLAVARVSNGIAGTFVEAISTSAADSGDVFRFDPSCNQYVFNLSTKPLATGTWSLHADLGDAVTHTINVSLK